MIYAFEVDHDTGKPASGDVYKAHSISQMAWGLSLTRASVSRAIKTGKPTRGFKSYCISDSYEALKAIWMRMSVLTK